MTHLRFPTRGAVVSLIQGTLFGLVLLSLPMVSLAQTPPPEPSNTSMVGDTVTNPDTMAETTVSELIVDPVGTATSGNTAFVRTDDNYVFLVKDVGETIYNNDPDPVGFFIVSADASGRMVQVRPASDTGATADTLDRWLTSLQYDALFDPEVVEPVPITPISDVESTGVRVVNRRTGGRNGRTGVFFFPPTAGEAGLPPSPIDYRNSLDIATTNRIGIEAGGIGGDGGKGGDSVFSFWNARSGGNGGAGGTVVVTNNSGFQVSATGDDRHGIFAYSRSGAAGNGGNASLAPDAGPGGAARPGGAVTITNRGNIFTSGDDAYGIFGLSQSNNGGDGGTQFGIVGRPGSGWSGGNGGVVTVTNGTTGTVQTSGDYSHGILGMSVGGSGGASGSANNLILSLGSAGAAGGNGGTVLVTNEGTISTTGDYSRGIFAQSIGGGGGVGGSAGGLIAIGGAGAGGGRSGGVTVNNNEQGVITTSGTGSDGIFAQSVGGSGARSSNTGGLVAIGGFGGGGGAGGTVTVNNFGSIATTEMGARGIVAQSVGGGGGDGSRTGGMVAVGGDAGAGGAGSTVGVTHGGLITTEGADANGIFVQSVGGGGGNGGSAGSISAFVGVAVGGKGNAGGDGGQVDVTLQGRSDTQASEIRTSGDRSSALFAQSVGGGGGNGGGSVQVSGGYLGAVSVAVGGDGGAAGEGGNVTLSNGDGVSIIETGGDDSTGVFLQSVGGGGGNGGYAVAVSVALGEGAGALSVGVGGKGNAGGDGGTVHVGDFDADGNLVETGLDSNIRTSGERSTGLIAQSVGGGGGNGGLAVSASIAGGAVAGVGVSVGVGGSGGAGGTGGEVLVATEGDITTAGNYSAGMLVQSVGGGGGNGGGSIAGTLAGSAAGGVAVAVGLGGDGGGGNLGGTVSLTTLDGTINTTGDSSNGVTAQSIGGGGGNGGYSVAVGVAVGGTAAGTVAVGLGGNGGTGSDGGTVTANLETNVNTGGDDSTGILVQSVGGGGGNGGFNVSVGAALSGSGAGSIGVGLGGGGSGGGVGGAVTANSTGAISTEGDNSSGFVAQSVGGGGGNGGFNVSGTLAGGTTGAAVSVGLGGDGGGGGDALTVTANTTGDVQTQGIASTGILAQSVGGGGGNGGFDVSVAINVASSGGGAGVVGIGGTGDNAGDGDIVRLNVANNVTTSGLGANGVVAQSIGGGGGSGALNVAIAGAGSSGVSLAGAVGIGGSGAGGGDGSDVFSDVNGIISTAGQNSSGVIAQSVGGGGGNGGISIGGAISIGSTTSVGAALGVGGSGGVGGDAGAVDHDVSGYVQTLGDNSVGVLTQSVGGGGGNGATAIGGAMTSAGTGGSFAFAVGGSGGAAGNSCGTVGATCGAAVTTLAADSLVNAGVITTGDLSTAVLTQSVGGGGGNGGVSVAGAVTLSQGSGGSLAFGVGGFGGAAGDSGNVRSVIDATDANPQIGTTGDESTAIIAQSIAGGGGNGGLNVSAALSMTSTSGVSVGLGVGGFGGGGGSAGEVTLDVDADVLTEGNDSHGILAQSLGGGGGNGGISIGGSVQLTSTGSGGAASLGVGGFGGAGGNSARIEVDYQGTLSARPADPDGLGSHGIVAQSIAGGGGNGGINIAGALSFTSSSGAGDGNALVLGVGGFGGSGGNAGEVDVAVVDGSRISSWGDERSAIFAQSVGGAGGSGGINVSAGITSDAPLVFGMGGFGGAAGTADLVTVNSGADLFASGEYARGIFAQSIGGGGGNGGLNVSGGVSFTESSNIPTVIFGIGGFGGDGNSSGGVNVSQRGTVMTMGEEGHGIFAQSIAGGGGNGALNISTALNFSGVTDTGTYKNLSLVAGIGGHGGVGADAGNTDVFSTGSIVTSGDYARGIFAQSVGGGGGNGSINFSGNLAKKSSLITMGVGGFGAGAGSAGTVTVTRGSQDNVAGVIATDGAGAHGIEASSIGGGGGDAGANIVAAIVLAEDGVDEPPPVGQTRQQPHHEGVDDDVFTNYDAVIAELQGRSAEDAGDEQDAEEGQSPYGVQIAVGGSGGGAGVGAVATVNNFGDVLTLQERSHGILAQSIGGGGGNAAYNVALTFLQEGARNRGLNLSLGGATGDGGEGDEVFVSHDGMIETFGADAHGILAQSIGGGGGNVGATMDVEGADAGKLSISIGRRGGRGGEGGGVNLTSTGQVVTHGDRSWGLLAQSIGNGGGNSSAISAATSGDRSASMSIGLEGGIGGEAGSVDVIVDGLVMTEGSDAHAVFAQSVGGGGGNGGDAGGAAANAAVSMGGTGGFGGGGGIVTVISGADITTLGRGSIGILGQSIGGGGGTGGKSEATITGNAAALAINLGGDGGDSAIGNDVAIETGGRVLTFGDDAHAVFAQSLGGGGGNGSMTISNLGGGGEDDDQPGGPQIAATVGGGGGSGAAGGNVSVINRGLIQAQGRNSSGIFAQSIGGGGGNASQVVTNLSASGSSTRLALGGIPGVASGVGGDGGMGGDVTVENLRDANGNGGQIVTTGANAHGIVAMSIGGGGGTGSTVISAISDDSDDLSLQPAEGTSIAMSIGGEGGEGGTSGLVTVINDGEITTLGDGAHGVFAQSIGGGGGNGGVVFVQQASLNPLDAPIGQNISVGGMGGDGNFSGDVRVTNNGTIDVSGDGAYGVFAQSIGGGGGNGGAAGEVISAAGSMSDTNGLLLPTLAPLMDLSLGGAGGLGADSGDVTVNHNGSIVSRGDDSFGIFAQSIAGGGGTIGASYNSAIGAARDFLLPIFMGSNSGTGVAGEVVVTTEGDIIMLGANSRSHNVQSVNGGGGNFNMTVDVSDLVVDDNVDGDATIGGSITMGAIGVEEGTGSNVVVIHAGDLVTLGRNSSASLTQSVGGGGGSGQFDVTTNEGVTVDVSATLGSMDSVNSNGGNLDLIRDGNVMTAGDNSTGTTVQSIGGGGGTLIVDVTTSGTDGDEITSGVDKTVQVLPDKLRNDGNGSVADESRAGAVTVNFGANSSVGNNGGTIDLTFRGDHMTDGELSPALLVQSIGGGGGDARFLGLETVTASFGGTNNSTGNGGDIAFENLGNVFTSGALSHGVVFQSIGGGGGFALTDLDAGQVDWSLSTANQGSGGSITFDQSGDIVVTGDRSIALLAQSLGGGGGVLDSVFMGTSGGAGAGGDITIQLDGSLMASGNEGIGLFAQSDGADGQGSISITLASDHFIFAGENGTAVSLFGGANNALDNFGTIMTADEIDGLALSGVGGTTQINNYGWVMGNVALSSGTNGFNNEESGRFSAGSIVDLGSALSLLTNDGELLPGHVLNAQAINLNGSFLQSANATTVAEIDFASNTFDQLFATGNIELDGTLQARLMNTHLIPVGSFSEAIFTGDLGLINSGLTLDTAASVVVQYDLDFTDNAALLEYNVNFAVDGLGENLTAVGEYINRGQIAGGGNVGYGNIITKLVFDPDLDTYRESLSQLSPDFYAEHQVQLVNSSIDFGQRLLSCEQPMSGHRAASDGSCVWAQLDAYSTDQDAEFDFKAVNGSTSRFSVGAQKSYSENWTFGFGLSKENNDSDGYDGNWQSDSSTNLLGLSAVRSDENTQWSGILSYGTTRVISRRNGNLLGDFQASVTREMDTLAGLLRVAHNFERGQWYLRPSLSLGVLELRVHAAEEKGAGAASLLFNDNDETHVWLQPALEVGREIAIGVGNRMRFSLELSMQDYLTGSVTDVEARLVGAPLTIDPLSVDADLGDPLIRSKFGVSFFTKNNVNAQLFIDSGYYDRGDIDSINLRFEYPLR